MQTRIRAALMLGLATALWAGVQAQEKNASPAARAQAAKGGIAWVASYDLAVRKMGADRTPVILYFTYDG